MQAYNNKQLYSAVDQIEDFLNWLEENSLSDYEGRLFLQELKANIHLRLREYPLASSTFNDITQQFGYFTEDIYKKQ
jgi:hypothetical protein